MVAYRKPHFYTPEEYLRLERETEHRNEYYDGVILAMAGAKWEHNEIVGAVFGELYAQLKRSGCRALVENTRVRVSEYRRYYYPDVLVVCGEPEYEEMEGVDTLLNPSIVFEVLSKSTERVDRGEKLHCYRTLPSLRAYILVYQDRPLFEIWLRASDGGGWLYGEVEGLDAELPLEGVGCTLRLADVYARVTFPPKPDADYAASERQQTLEI